MTVKIRNREQAADLAEKRTTNVPGTCQMVTREYFGAPSAGDRDHDGDADALDGWASEPKKTRHSDRNPPRGVPVAFGGGKYGHRAISLGGGKLRSTDMKNGRYSPGHTGTCSITDIEQHMGKYWLGWSETIDGYMIPKPAKKKPVKLHAPKRPPKSWHHFVHLLARHYQNYWTALDEAHKKGIGIDIDAQHSKEGTGWGLHWATVGKNHLHDPKGKIKSTARLDHLTDVEIGRLRGPNGQRPRKLIHLMTKANKLGVRVELEVKVRFKDEWVKKFMNAKDVRGLRERHLLQIKTLASLGSNPVPRLAVWHKHGAITMLTFTGYDGKGISKKKAWPVTDYVRGRGKWIA